MNHVDTGSAVLLNPLLALVLPVNFMIGREEDEGISSRLVVGCSNDISPAEPEGRYVVYMYAANYICVLIHSMQLLQFS